jgi:hypothetical protein
MSYKLFIPGPVAVSEKTLRAMSQPMIGHRSTDFVALYNSIQPELQALCYTQDPVYLSTSSAWGVMEGALRNVVKKKVLNCMNGAFSDKWYDVALRCGKQATALKFEWGQPVDPEAVRKELATGSYDALTLIHNETSCGCMSDLPAIMAVIREFPEVIAIIDFSQHSSKERFYIIDMKTGNVETFLVAHGKNSDPNHDGFADVFSNKQDSLMSSQGFYITGESYIGKKGHSLRLDGLSSSNSKAREREIVIHGADYVAPRIGTIGRSWGCPAVEFRYVDEIIKRIKNGALLLAQ